MAGHKQVAVAEWSIAAGVNVNRSKPLTRGEQATRYGVKAHYFYFALRLAVWLPSLVDPLSGPHNGSRIVQAYQA